ncbi:MAG: type 1 glutamine amidotransferase family protein [Ilumatobacteraceae bacterium]
MTAHSDLPHIIAIMGSGETAPTMVPTHRALVAKLPQPGRVVLLDTPYGFQENSSELSGKATEYFDKSINVDLHVAGLTRLVGDSVDPLVIERGLQAIADAHYVFAGPGSPSYALRQWAGSPLVNLLVDKIHNGGIVTFASAAALTLGRFTLPVYEIYKVGQEPCWLDGLDLMSEIGLHVAVIPHYNNAEGGHHDTRFCYMGERRLSMLEDELPNDVYVLGVDEHTGVVIDLDADTATVVGKSVATIRVRGISEEFTSGTVLPLDRLRDPNVKTSLAKPVLSAPVKTVGTSDGTSGDTNLRAATDRLNAVFASALAQGDADGAGRAVLELDDAIAGWSADTLQSDDADHARAVMRSMVGRLAAAASEGLRDPRDVLGPVIEVLLELRTVVRSDKRFDLSDLIRDRLTAIEIEVRDTPAGVEWEIRPKS